MKKKTLPKLKKEQKCKQCGLDFEVPNWRLGVAKYCSYDCAIKAKTTAKSYRKERICLHCEAKYYPTSWGQKYCGKGCAYKARTKYRIASKCPVCNIEFTTVRKGQIYCSAVCGIKSTKAGRPHIAFSNKSPKAKRVYLDNLWSEIVKLMAGGQCEYCGKESSLNSHHIFSRSRLNLRWETDNGVCLCAGHHVLSNSSAHKAPIEFVEWLREKRGDAWYDGLRIKSREIVKLTNADKLSITNSLKLRIQEIREG